MALTAPFFFSCSTHYPSILWLCGILPVCAAPKCENWLTQKPVTWQNKARYKNNNNHSKSMQTLKHGKIWLHLTKTCWSSLCKKEMNIEHWEYKVWSLDGSLLNPADRWCQTVTMWVMRKEMSSSLFFGKGLLVHTVSSWQLNASDRWFITAVLWMWTRVVWEMQQKWLDQGASNESRNEGLTNIENLILVSFSSLNSVWLI